jgi:polar amino acid transport system permease protein
MKYDWNFNFLGGYSDLLVTGVLNTLLYTAISIVLACILGMVIAICRMSGSRLINYPIIAFIEVFRCTPFLVQLIWFYYAFPVLVGIDMPASAAAIIALTLYGGVFYAEVFRGGIGSIEYGQWDAGRGLGMTDGRIMRRIILPQATRRMIPSFVNQSIMQLKNTSLVSTLAIAEIVYQGGRIAADTYRPLEVYTVIAVIYFAMLFPMTMLAQYAESRLGKKGD